MAEVEPLRLTRESFTSDPSVSPESEVAYICSKCGTRYTLGSWNLFVSQSRSGANQEILDRAYLHAEECVEGAEMVFHIQGHQNQWLPATY